MIAIADCCIRVPVAVVVLDELTFASVIIIFPASEVKANSLFNTANSSTFLATAAIPAFL